MTNTCSNQQGRVNLGNKSIAYEKKLSKMRTELTLLLFMTMVAPIHAQFQLDISINHYENTGHRLSSGLCCTCGNETCDTCVSPHCTNNLLVVYVYGGNNSSCVSGGCDLWGVHQISLGGDESFEPVLIPISGQSFCPTGPLEVVIHVYNEVIASENLIGILLTTTPQLIPGSSSDNFTQTSAGKYTDEDGPSLSLAYRLLCVPSTPTVIVHFITTSTIFISWSNENNADMYQVTWSSGSIDSYMTLPGHRSSYEIRTNLDAGSSYMVMVTASNSVGSSDSDVLVLTTVPARPVVRVQAATDSILVCWSATGPMVDMVIVEWSVSGGGTADNITVLNSSNNYTITGLEQGTSYIVQVNAVNSGGVGDIALMSTSTLMETEDGGVCPNVVTVVLTSTTVTTVLEDSTVHVTITATPTPIVVVESQSSDACQTGLTAGLTILGVGVIVLLCILVVLLLVHVVRRKKPSLKPASAPAAGVASSEMTVVEWTDPVYDTATDPSAREPEDTSRRVRSHNFPMQMSINHSYQSPRQQPPPSLVQNHHPQQPQPQPQQQDVQHVDEGLQEDDYLTLENPSNTDEDYYI